MPPYTPEQIAILQTGLRLLGYNDSTDYRLIRLAGDNLLPEIFDRILEIEAGIVECLDIIQTSLKDSLAVQVGELKLSYSQQIVLAKLQGRTLENELANLLDVPVHFSRFSLGRKRYQVG
jgi:hypothetical protein